MNEYILRRRWLSRRFFVARWISLLVAGLLVLSAEASLAGEVKTLPPAPTLQPDMHSFEIGDDGHYVLTHPYVTPLAVTKDGRVGMLHKRRADKISFHLFVPEKFRGSGKELMEAGNGARIVSPHFVELDHRLLDAETTSNAVRAGHYAICDPTQGSRQNPYACGEGLDCYDLKVVSAVTLRGETWYADFEVNLWSVDVTIKVRNPKTAAAEIADVVVTPARESNRGPSVKGFGLRGFHTPMIVGRDNRVLAARFGPASQPRWTDNQGRAHSGDTHDILYAVNTGAECDINGWSDFKPLAYAPSDADLVSTDGQRYGFAERPFRTPDGITINSDPGVAPLDEIRGRYFWLDQDAKNIFFGSLGRKLIDGSTECQEDPATCRHLYDVSCFPGTTCTDPANPDSESASLEDPTETHSHQGWMMMGRWTHGKMVLLDHMFNHTDFALEGEEEHHRLVRLFSDLEYRVGAGRDTSLVGPDRYLPEGWGMTTVRFASNEHLLNAVPEMKPRTPRDVVWIATSGSRTAEIPFDDYLDRGTIIFSPMNAVRSMLEVDGHYPYYDGNDPLFPEMRLQNAATTLKWQIPSHGQVVLPAIDGETKGRIENVALGGIEARGFHLHEQSRIDYEIPEQLDGSPKMGDQEWAISLFLDRTSNPGRQPRRLLTFPAGAFIELAGPSTLKVCAGSSALCRSVQLVKPLPPRGWTHLAFHLSPATAKLRLFQDGFLFAETPLPMGMAIEPGTLTVGSADDNIPGVSAWIDELRVVEGAVSFEKLCNDAHGTLVAVPSFYARLARLSHHQVKTDLF